MAREAAIRITLEVFKTGQSLDQLSVSSVLTLQCLGDLGGGERAGRGIETWHLFQAEQFCDR